MGVADNPKYRRINEDIAAGRFYDSLQHVISVTKRAAVAKKFDEALELLHHYAVVYIEVKEYGQSLELLKEYINIAKQSSPSYSETNIDHFVSYVNAIMKAVDQEKTVKEGSSEKGTVLDHCLFYMEQITLGTENPKLNRVLGKYHADRNELLQAQKYLVYAKDVELLFSVIEKWASYVDEHEKGHVYLRCVLIQLAIGDYEGAKCLLLLLNVDLDNAEELPLALHLAHILTELPEHPDYQLYKLVCKTYRPVIDSDKNFPRLISAIRERLFPGRYDPTDPYCAMPTALDGDNNPMTALLRSLM